MNNIYIKSFLFAVATVVLAGVALAEDTDLHVSTGEAIKAATSKVQPDYPPMAKQLGLRGEVEVEAHIDESGSVESVKAKTGNPILANAAVEAARHWKFTPFTANGKPVKVVAELTFNFKM